MLTMRNKQKREEIVELEARLQGQIETLVTLGIEASSYAIMRGCNEQGMDLYRRWTANWLRGADRSPATAQRVTDAIRPHLRSRRAGDYAVSVLSAAWIYGAAAGVETDAESVIILLWALGAITAILDDPNMYRAGRVISVITEALS